MRVIVPIQAPGVTPAASVRGRRAVSSVVRDSVIEMHAESAAYYHPRGGVALLLVDQVVARAAEPVMRALVANSVLRRIRHVAENIDGPGWQQCPAFHAFTTLAGIESQLGDGPAGDAWLARLAEIEAGVGGQR